MKREIYILRITIYLFAILFSFGIESVLSQEKSKIELQQYLFPDFSRSTVKVRNGKTVTILLNYNIVTEKMVFEQNGEYFDLANPESVDTAYIHNRAFIQNEDAFLEVAVKGSLPFFIQHKGELIPPGRPAGYGSTSQTTSSNYLSGLNTPQGYYNFKLPDGYTVRASSVYWVRINGEMENFIGERQFLKLFPDKADQLKKYLKDSKLKIEKREDFLRLTEYCNKEL